VGGAAAVLTMIVFVFIFSKIAGALAIREAILYVGCTPGVATI
jgi:hypothetical protein